MPARQAPAPKGGGNQEVFGAALGVLDDPDVRELILEQSKKVIDAVQKWLSKNGPSLADRFRGRFGQKGLERRAARLRGAVATLSRSSNALAASLRPVNVALDEVDQLLTVAEALPFTKRKRAHMRIDDVLDDLESGLFDATRRGARPGSEV
jgi:hypothetical protein